MCDSEAETGVKPSLMWNLELSLEDSSSSGHMKKNKNVRWVSWAWRIAARNFMWGCEIVRLGLSLVDSPSMWPLVRNAHVRWFRPETKFCCVINWMVSKPIYVIFINDVWLGYSWFLNDIWLVYSWFLNGIWVVSKWYIIGF